MIVIIVYIQLYSQVEEGVAKQKVNRTLNSCIVALNFKKTKNVDFTLRMKSNTSRDGDYK